MSVGQFIHILSIRLHLTPGKALFVFVENTLPQTGRNAIKSLGSYLLWIHCMKVFALIICWYFLHICILAASLMDTVYESFKDEDGFLYMSYSSEKTFGYADIQIHGHWAPYIVVESSICFSSVWNNCWIQSLYMRKVL